MSNFTTKIKDVVDNTSLSEVQDVFKNYDLHNFLTNDQIAKIEEFGVWSKEKLAEKIVNHYYFREIGFETWGQFVFRAKIEMEELMEKYSRIIYSNSIKFDPLVNVDFTETFGKTNTGTSTNNGTSTTQANSTNDGLNIFSDTPNAGLNIQNIKDGKYASNVNSSNANSDTTTSVNDTVTTNVNNQEDYVKNVKGNSGVSATAQMLLKQYRDTIVDVDNKIIDGLNVLFMGIFE